MAVHPGRHSGEFTGLRSVLFNTPTRTLQSVLGIVWLLDGALQFQSFMYSHGFVEMLKDAAAGQPGWAHDSIIWAANIAAGDLGVWNTLFAALQVLIGLSLLYRPTVRMGLILTCAWALGVWWFGEGFAMMLMPSLAAPLTGAPGAVVYVLVALIAWPNGRPGGLLGARGARIMWAALWLVLAWCWLGSASAAPNAVHDMINAAPSGMSWLSSVQDAFASLARGNGVVISLILAVVSAAVGIGVAADWCARQFLALAVILNLAFWVVGQGFGGIFAGGATDPNMAPLIILLAYGLYRLIPDPLPHTEEVATP